VCSVQIDYHQINQQNFTKRLLQSMQGANNNRKYDTEGKKKTDEKNEIDF